MADLPVLTIHERDITSQVCQRCARCCTVEIRLPNTDSRYRRFLRTLGYELLPVVVEGKDDCCDDVHEATLKLGPCKHLLTAQTQDGPLYTCGLYGDARRPQLCDHFNCVSWAKAGNLYAPTNELLRAAEAALQRVRTEDGRTA